MKINNSKMKEKVLLVVMVLSLNVGLAQKWGATPEDSVNCLKNLSLYQQYYKQKAYDDALTFWRKCVEICPKSSEALYTRGVKLYEYQIKKNKANKELKEKLIDTLFMVYDWRIEHFGKRAYVLGRKGSDMMQYRKSDSKAAYETFEESFKGLGNDMEAGAIVFMYMARYEMYKKEESTKSELIQLYPRLKAVADFNIKNAKDEKERKKYQTSADNLLQFFKEVAECQDLVEAYKPVYDQNKDNPEMLAEILGLLDTKDCSDQDFYIEVAKRLQEIKPSPRSAYSIANWYAAKGNCGSALEFYIEAFETADNMTEEDKAPFKVNAGIATAKCYLVTNQYSRAKIYANKVLGVDPNNGTAYMIIGDAYMYGATECGDNPCAKKAAYWVAVDKYYVAKGKDPSLGEKINPKIARAKGLFPTKEDCFFYGITEGSDFKVDCWVGETTKVRFN